MKTTKYSTWNVPLQKVSEEEFVKQAQRLKLENEAEVLSHFYELRHKGGRITLYFGQLTEKNKFIRSFRIERRGIILTHDSWEMHVLNQVERK